MNRLGRCACLLILNICLWLLHTGKLWVFEVKALLDSYLRETPVVDFGGLYKELSSNQKGKWQKQEEENASCVPPPKSAWVSTLLQQLTSQNHMFFLTSADCQKSLVCILHCSAAATLSWASRSFVQHLHTVRFMPVYSCVLPAFFSPA